MPIIYLLRYLKSLFKKQRIFGALGLTLSLVVLCSLLVFFFEIGKNPNIKSFGDILWWSIVTISTVGYGDIAPVTVGGRITSVFMMLFGIGFLATLMGSIVSVLIEFNERRTKGMASFNFKQHFVICGWYPKTEELILEIKGDKRYQDKEVIIIDDKLEQLPEEYKHVYFVKGRATDPEVLQRANVKECYSAIILARNPEDPRSDYETVSTVLTIERIERKVFTCAELVDTKNKKLLEDAYCDAIIDIGSLTGKIIIQSILDPGVNDVVSELVSTREGQQYYLVDLPKKYANKEYKIICHDLIDKGVNVFGIRRKDKVLVNPAITTKLEDEDKVYVISKEVPRI
ncbi:potassium channel family protein [Candidatus Margulisiibacteriota bacterium]